VLGLLERKNRQVKSAQVIIILKRRDEEKSYWKRNSDEITGNVLVSLLVGAVFWILSLIFK